jgi:hypothetical protein
VPLLHDVCSWGSVLWKRRRVKAGMPAGGCSKKQAEALHDLLTKRSFMVNVFECKEDKTMRAV